MIITLRSGITALFRQLGLRGAAAVAGNGGAALPVAVIIPGDLVHAMLALMLPLFFYCYGLDDFPLRDNNEGLYAEIAREMVSTGNYIVPHLNGVPYIEKPPLLYWLMSLSMTLFGVSAPAVRLVSALSMFALCAGLYQFCRLHGHRRAGCYAAVGMASALPASLLAHAALFDPLLTALLGGALLCFLHAWLSDRRGPVRAASVLLALAVLEKGVVALALAVGIIGLFLLLMRGDWRRHHLFDPIALALFAVLVVPWHAAAAWMQPEFSWFYFVNEHLLRFLGTRQPDDYHHGPIWFYLPRLLLMLMPWTPFLLLLSRPAVRRNRDLTVIVRFCQAGLAFPLLFFSLSQAKADYYLLVAMPMLALWLGLEVATRLAASGAPRHAAPSAPREGSLLGCCWGMAGASLVLIIGLLSIHPQPVIEPPAMMLLALLWLALSVLGARLFVCLAAPRGHALALLCAALAAVPAMGLVMRQVEDNGARKSSRDIAMLIGPATSRKVFIYRDYEDVFSSLPFYLERAVPVIDSDSRDLQFGCRLRPERACIAHTTFQQRSAGLPVAVAVRADRADEFRAIASWRAWDVVTVGDKLVFFSKDG